jgi:hypothetical protein
MKRCAITDANVFKFDGGSGSRLLLLLVDITQIPPKSSSSS